MADPLHDGDIGNEQRFSADRKLIIAVSVFCVAGILLMILSNITTSTISSLRGYATMQANWIRDFDEASLHAIRYIEEGDRIHYTKFHQSVARIRHATTARKMMDREDNDNEIIADHLRAIGTSPDDIRSMIWTYEVLGGIRYFREAIDLWNDSDSLVYEVDEMIQGLMNARGDGRHFDSAHLDSLQQSVKANYTQVVHNEKALSGRLGQGVRLLETITLWATTGVGIMLLVIGVLFTYRFRKSIKKWRKQLIHSEKRYRSLFDQNPNAVYSLDKEGHFLSGNRALEEMTGYTNKELHEMSFTPLVHPDYREKVQKHFKKASEGIPQNYDSIGMKKDGSLYHVSVSNLPIVVGREIVGVYGIAQDITERKVAEQQVRKSLKEKESLLEEIHHRVKNNLAVISGLLDLQADSAEHEKTRMDLLNTRSRIHSMAMIHEKLYHSESLSSIDMNEYIKELYKEIKSVYTNGKDIRCRFETQTVYLDITQAVPCGLLINELAVNAFKYAFEGLEKGQITVKLYSSGDRIHVEVSDDGVGLPQDIDPHTSTSLGMSLIKSLTAQLEGEIKVVRNDGTRYHLNFPHKDGEFLQTS